LRRATAGFEQVDVATLTDASDARTLLVEPSPSK
jgi:hypothetical protein